MNAPSAAPICLADVVIRTLRGKWAMQILLAIDDQEERSHFNHLKRTVPGISAKVLTEQLRYLLAAGVIRRMPSDQARLEVFYAYTDQGRELRSLLDSLNEMGQRWLAQERPSIHSDADAARDSEQ